MPFIWRVDGEETWDEFRQRSTAEADSGVYNSGVNPGPKAENKGGEAKVGTPTVTLRLAGGISRGRVDDENCGLDRFPKDSDTPPSSTSSTSSDAEGASAAGLVMKRARY